MTRIAITGPESSGKTKLASDLANYFKVEFVPEFAREYLLAQNCEYDFSDLDKIAEGHLHSIENAKSTNPLIVDTDMLVMHIWSMVKYGKVSSLIQKKLNEQRFDLYILCDIDIPWESDPLRENEYDRDDLFQLYYKKLRDLNVNFIVVKGSPKERLSLAITQISALR